MLCIVQFDSFGIEWQKSNEESLYLSNKRLLICLENCVCIAGSPAASCVGTKRTAARCISSLATQLQNLQVHCFL
jgi:hypothetical protein